MQAGERLEVTRGEVVVCVRGDGAAETLRSVLERTDPNVPVLVNDPTVGANERVLALDPKADVVAAAAPADVVLLDAGCVVADGWLPALREAAYVDAAIATACGISADRGDREFDEAARIVATASLRLRPRLSAPRGPCVYVRRTAIELAGDVTFGFWRLCLDAGLQHVLADDVLIDDRRPRLPDGDPDSTEPLARATGAVKRALTGVEVVIDGRILSGALDGTRVAVLELIGGLARTRSVKLAVLVDPGLGSDTRALLEGLGLALIGGTERSPVRADLVHRPFQVSTPADLTVLAQFADRFVISHQDLISYHTPAYFSSTATWEGYRELTRHALAVADHVVFGSAHARDDALAEDLVEHHRATVVQIGVDHPLARTASARPAGAGPIGDEQPVILCLGSDYMHKNRLFALQVLEQLRTRWTGVLVMAGPRVQYGSSLPDERELMEQQPELAAAVLDLGPVGEAEKNWLLERASLVLYPTVHEGFGLVPFEAAARGVPSMWAAGTALSDALPDTAAAIVAWDAAASADAALSLLSDEPARQANVDAVRAAGAELTWDRTALRMLELYRRVCDGVPAPAGAFERSAGLMQHGVSEDGMRLVGPDGVLPAEVERPLLALASHPKIGGPVLGAIKAGYRASQRWRRDG